MTFKRPRWPVTLGTDVFLGNRPASETYAHTEFLLLWCSTAPSDAALPNASLPRAWLPTVALFHRMVPDKSRHRATSLLTVWHK